MLRLGRVRRLLRVELPLSAIAIMAGMKTAAVTTVGTATLAAFIGGGGYGTLIVRGLALDDTATILAGAAPAAAHGAGLPRPVRAAGSRGDPAGAALVRIGAGSSRALRRRQSARTSAWRAGNHARIHSGRSKKASGGRPGRRMATRRTRPLALMKLTSCEQAARRGDPDRDRAERGDRRDGVGDPAQAEGAGARAPRAVERLEQAGHGEAREDGVVDHRERRAVARGLELRVEARRPGADQAIAARAVLLAGEPHPLDAREPAGARVQRPRHPLPRAADAEGQLEGRVGALGRDPLDLLGEREHAHPLAVGREEREQLPRERGGRRGGARGGRDLVAQVVVDVEGPRRRLRVRAAVLRHQAGWIRARAK